VSAEPEAVVRRAVEVAASGRLRDRRFFLAMGAAIVLTVFAGFAPTYYLRDFFTSAPLAPLLHLHGLLFTSWVALVLVQMLLVSRRRVDVHRRLGVAGAVLAAVAVAVAFAAAISAARRGFTPPGAPPPLVFLVIPIGDLAVFSTLVAGGLLLRAKRDWHKRLMLMATLAILTPAIARLPGVIAGGPPAFFGLTDLFILACLIYDRVANGRTHPAFLLGGLFVIVSQPLRLLVASTGVWMAFARWLVS
jgi:hypothetical protein